MADERRSVTYQQNFAFLRITAHIYDFGAVLGKGCLVRRINVGGKPLTQDMVAFVTGQRFGCAGEEGARLSEGWVEAYAQYGDCNRISIVIHKWRST